MVKWRKLSKKDIANEPLHRWLAWFDQGSPPELVAEVISMDTAIQKANERQEYVLSDDDALRIYEMRQKAHWDLISTTNYARETGYAEGLKEGIKDGIEKGINEGLEKSRAEIALKMKNAGRPFGEISEFTGLSPEVIDSL